MTAAQMLSGTFVGLVEENRNGPDGSFVSREVGVQVGEGLNLRVERVRCGRDFPLAWLPKPGEPITLDVWVSSFRTRNGAGHQFYSNRIVTSDDLVSWVESLIESGEAAKAS